MKKYILLFFSFLLCLTAYAQKYKKNSFFDNGEKRIYYEIFYKSGCVGLSVDTKKNVICGEDRGYTKIDRTHIGVETFIVKKGNFSGVIDMNGNEIIKPNRYQYIDDEIGYASGCCTFRYYKVGNGGSQYSPEKQGACSVTGEEIIPCLYKKIELDKIIYKYNDKDYAGFYFKGKTSQNHIVLSDTLDETLFYSDKYDYAYMRMKDKTSSSDFKDNIIGYEVVKDGKHGFCDKKGNEIILPIYEDVNCNDTFGYPIYTIKQNGKLGVITENGSVLIEPQYDHIYLRNEDFCFFYVEMNGKNGVLSENGSVLIKPIYDNVCYHSDKYEFNHHFSIEQNKKHGWCDCNGNIIFEPVFNNVIIYSSGKYKTKINEEFVELNPADYAHYASNTHKGQAKVSNQSTNNDIETKRANLAERIDRLGNKIQALEAKISSNRQSTQSTASTSTSSYFSPSSSNNDYAPSSSTSYSSNANSQYKALNDPNLVDNSEKIASAHQLINDLESKKRNCNSCHGTGSVPKLCTVCRGTGTRKVGYYTPQYFTCTWCQGTGKEKTQCMECYQTNMAISLAKLHLENLKETHGMTKETEKFYYEHKNKMAQMDRDYQNSINAIAEPYLNSTRKSNSSNSSTSSSSKCSMCNGTGIDSHAYYRGDPKPAVGGYTHSSGGKCMYCGKYEWHQHVYCPKCNANKYP